MLNAETIRNEQLRERLGKSLPKTIKDVFNDYVEQRLNEVFIVDYSDEPMSYNEYLHGKKSFNRKYQNKYGILFDIYDLMKEYNLNKSYFDHFMKYAEIIAAEIRKLGYVVKFHPKYNNGICENVEIEILWQDICTLDESEGKSKKK